MEIAFYYDIAEDQFSVDFLACLFCFCVLLKRFVCRKQKFEVKKCRTLKKVEKHFINLTKPNLKSSLA